MMWHYSGQRPKDKRSQAIAETIVRQEFNQRLALLNKTIEQGLIAEALGQLLRLIELLNDPHSLFSIFERKEAFAAGVHILETLAIVLSEADQEIKRKAFVQIEQWHADGKPKFIMSLPALHLIMFS